MKKAVIILLILLGTGAIIYGAMYYFADVREVNMRNQVVAHVESRDAVYDNTIKKIAQSFEISTEGERSFKDVFVSYMESRSSAYGTGGGKLMQWIQEAVPDGDFIALFSTTQRIMEAARNELTIEQKKLTDVNREHKNVLMTGWTSWFVGDRVPVEFNLITSTRTNEAADSGIDDDINLKK